MKSEQQCAWIEECQQEVWGSCYWCKQPYCMNHLITVAVYEKNLGRDRIEEDDVCPSCLAQRYQELGQKLEEIRGESGVDQELGRLWARLHRRSLQRKALQRQLMQLEATPRCFIIKFA
jgi:hypothetical protein